MKIGKLNHRITLETVSRTSDNLGGYTTTVSTVKTTWAGVRSLSAKEILSFGLELGERNLEFTIRNDRPITQTNSIDFGGRKFRIKSIIDPTERNYEYKIIASERTD
jgi:SPP1 family predicted phage head-tail adaptor